MQIEISFDDGTAQDWEVAELIVKHGLEKYTTFFLPVMTDLANGTKGRLSLTQQQKYDIAKNFTIGSHTITHRLLTRIPLNEARDEIFESRKLLQQTYNQDINEFCYPRGYANLDIQNLVQEAGYKSARAVSVGNIYPSENKFMKSTTVHVGYDRREYGGLPWFDYAMYMLNLARDDKNAVFSMWGHGYELLSYPSGKASFDQLLKEVKDASGGR